MIDGVLVAELVDRIKPVLAHHDPAVQGGVCADLMAIWIAGHHPDLREKALWDVIAAVRDLVPINAAQMGVFER